MEGGDFLGGSFEVDRFLGLGETGSAEAASEEANKPSETSPSCCNSRSKEGA